MTSKQLLAAWKPRLKLSDWTITVERISKAKCVDENSEPCQGLCWWMPEERKATVQIVHGAPLQETLVHELLHIVLQGHQVMETGERHYDPQFERGINDITAALVGTKWPTVTD